MLQINISKRAALVLAVALVLVIPGVAVADHIFDDVSDGSAHIEGITFMKDSGVSIGCDANNNYCPNDNVSRDQMGTFMYRLSGNDPATDPSVHAASALSPVAVAGSVTGVSVSSTDWTEVGSVEITIPDSVGDATIIAHFSAETVCEGGVNFLIGPWCAGRMLIDGAEMTPADGTGNALDSSDGATESLFSWESHAFNRYATGFGPGTYTVSVEVSSQGTTPPTFNVGNWSLIVTASPTS